MYKTVLVDDEQGIHDDSNLRISYHRIDVSLMNDTDIQSAMMRSASAETLPCRDAVDVSQVSA